MLSKFVSATFIILNFSVCKVLLMCLSTGKLSNSLPIVFNNKTYQNIAVLFV